MPFFSDPLWILKIGIGKNMRLPSGPLIYICIPNVYNLFFLSGQFSRKEKDVPVCNLCKKTFSKPQYLKRHIESCHNQKNTSKYICQYCGVSLRRYDNYCHHLKNCKKSNDYESASRKKCFKCSQCSKSYYRKQELNRHVLAKHSNESIQHCAMCNFTTPYTSILKRHLHNVHNKFKSLYRCSTCLIDFRTDYGLTRHRKYKCSSVAESNTCKLCCIWFKTFNLFKNHLKTEHADAVSAFVENGTDLEDILHSFNTVSDFLEGDNSWKATETPLELTPTELLLMGD